VNPVKRILRAAGKSDRKVVAVFTTTRAAAERAVAHLRAGVELPIWLFTREEPLPETAALCERVVVSGSAAHLWWRAQRELWPYWTALGVAEWTGKRGDWFLKAAPFCIPPFRALILNESGDFFSGSPGGVVRHARRRAREVRVSMANRGIDIARGGGLFCFAFVAQWYSPLSRYAFGKLRREHGLTIEAAPPAGGGVARFEYKNREWNRGALLQLLAETDARWILFERAGEQEAWDDLAGAFDDPNTFAVSRQMGVRGWRKLLFATAPFRALQRDERARVLAPVSPQMLVDRAKLAALGAPDLSSFGSNWFLLFWKAAAAGWKSYSAGSQGKAGELAAVPYDEAEFVKTLLDDPAMRRLAPREPDLARGSIVQYNGPSPGFRGLPRVLIVSPYLPYPLSHGGAVRIYNMCRALGDRVDFVLACFRERGDKTDYAKLYEVFREVYVVDVDEKNTNPALPKQVSEYETAGMRALIGNLCREKKIALLQVEYTQMAAYREAAPATPAILVEHDLTFTLYRQFAERDPGEAAQREYRNWLSFERERLRAYDAVWTMSELDREGAMAEGSARERTLAIPNGVDLRRFSCGAQTAAADKIFYVGSFRHRPNYLGFEELRNAIMPAVWRAFPEVRLHVVAGPDHLKHWPGAKELDPRITVYGFVEDLIPHYREASLVVVPLPVSAGTNIKLMEALACERAVVTTPVGCAGLELMDGSDALIRDLGPAFADAICDLLRDPAKRARVAAQGRNTARERFSWESIAAKAYECYEAMLAGKPCG
jgi:glycosyltransferase involved in cell wall biosynthesis